MGYARTIGFSQGLTGKRAISSSDEMALFGVLKLPASRLPEKRPITRDLWDDVGASGGEVRELRELLAKEALAFLHSAENGNGNLSCQ
jgi:hypothetical protein